MDHYTEVTRTGYGTNLTNSFKGIIFGLLLLIGSIVLLIYNENRSINQIHALEEMQSNLITLPNTQYDIQYEKKTVLLQGEVIPKKRLEDSLTGLTYNGLILERVVEMYQWQEEKETEKKDEVGGSTTTTTTYHYTKRWSSSVIDSSRFAHPEDHNNPHMPYSNEHFISDASLGDFYLNNNVINRFPTREDNLLLSTLPKEVNQFTNYHAYLYQGPNPQEPQIGDLKISYRVAPQGTYSLAGQVQGSAIVPYLTKNDRQLLFVRNGMISAEQIFQEEFDSNTLLTWLLRGLGLFLMFFGFILIMDPLSTLLKVLPLFSSVMSGMTALVALILTLILGSVVIALAWFGSRPMLSLTIIGIGTALAWGIHQVKKQKASVVQSTQATPPPRRK